MATSIDALDAMSSRFTQSLSNMVSSGITGGFSSVSRLTTSAVENAMLRGVQSGLGTMSRAVSAGIGEAVGTGREVIGQAIEEANQRAGQILQEVVGKVSEWKNYLTQNILGGLSKVLSGFVDKTGTLLNGLPGRIGQMFAQFIQRMTGMGRGGLPRIGNAARNIVPYFSGLPGRVAQGGVMRALMSRYDPRTGRYHSLLNNRFMTMGAGRGDQGGGSLLGGITARIREAVSNIANALGQALGGIAGTIKNVLAAAWDKAKGAFSDLFTPLVNTIQEGLSAARKAFLSAMRSMWSTIKGVASDIFEVIRGVAAALFDAVDGLMQGALKSTLSAIGSTLQALMSNPYALVAGIIAIFGGAVATTNTIATAIVSGLKSFGAALTSLFGAIWTFVSPILTAVRSAIVTGMNAVAGAFKTLWGWLTSAVGSLWQALQGVWAKIGGLSGIGSFLSGFAQSLMSGARLFFTNLLALVTGALQIGVAGVAMGAFAKAVYEAAKSAMEFAKSAQALSATSGRSFASSANLLMSGRVLGISDSSMQQAYGENTFINRIKGAIWNVDQTDIASVAGKFQRMMRGGFASQIMAQAMVKNLGMGSPDFMQALMQRPGAIRGQQSYQQTLQQRMGFSPAGLQKYATEVPLLLGKIGAAWTTLQMKLATVALPIIERLGTALASWVGANADKIGQWIEWVSEYIYVKMPVMLAAGLVAVSTSVNTALTAIIGFGKMVAEGLPKWLGTGVQAVADLMRRMADGLSKFAPIVIRGLADGLRTIGEMVGGWLDSLSGYLMDMTTNVDNPFRKLAFTIGTFIDFLIDKVASLAEAIGKNKAVGLFAGSIATEALNLATSLRGLPNAGDQVNKFFQNNPTIQGWSQSAANGADWSRRQSEMLAKAIEKYGTTAVDWTSSQLRDGANFLAPNGGPNLGEQIGNAAAKPIQTVTNFLEKNIKPGADAFEAAAHAFQKGIGTETDRKSQYQEMINEQKRTTQAVRDQAKELKLNNRELQRLAARVGAYTVQDAVLNNTRVT